jgi:hypothetical protein
MTEANEFDMRSQLRGIGIVHISEQDRVIDVARRCAKTGAAVGAGWAVLGAPALAPGAIAGFLSGFATGTAACMGLSYAAQETLKKIGTGQIAPPL